MNRRTFLGGLSVTGLGAVVWAMQPNDEQISDLEQDIQELDQRVSALETQVAEAPTDASSASTDDQDAATSAETVSVTGFGVSVSEPFTLTAGRYRVNATVQGGSGGYVFLILDIHDPSGGNTNLFNVMSQSSGSWEGSTIYNAQEEGEYFLQAENTDGPWTAHFEPF